MKKYTKILLTTVAIAAASTAFATSTQGSGPATMQRPDLTMEQKQSIKNILESNSEPLQKVVSIHTVVKPGVPMPPVTEAQVTQMKQVVRSPAPLSVKIEAVRDIVNPTAAPHPG